MDISSLVAMNLAIPDRENSGDRHYFEARLAPSFSMRRANGLIVDRQRFLDDLRSGGARIGLPLSQVALLGSTRAMVVCQIRIGEVVYDNLRILVRDSSSPEGWLLLSWANEALVQSSAGG